MGGLPRARTTLIAGTSGSAKTTLAVQYLAEGIKRGETGVFVTFEEFPRDIRKNMLSLGWNIENWEREGKWAFVNASTHPGEAITEAGNYDLAGLLVRIETAIKRVKATRVSLDSVGAVFSQFSDHSLVRRELFRITAAMKNSGVTTVLTAERTEEYGDITRFGVEEFVVDNVIILFFATRAFMRNR
jgi:circadian clock protein KaiC